MFSPCSSCTPGTASLNIFRGWSGACSGTGDCTVSMNLAQNVKAIFSTPTTLFASVNGPGSISSSPVGIACGADCMEGYSRNAQVTLTANPLQGSNFVNWSGACSGTQRTCTVSMSQIREVTANFYYYWPLLVTRTGSGTGTVTGVGINCGNDCWAEYRDGASMTLFSCTRGTLRSRTPGTTSLTASPWNEDVFLYPGTASLLKYIQ